MALIIWFRKSYLCLTSSLQESSNLSFSWPLSLTKVLSCCNEPQVCCSIKILENKHILKKQFFLLAQLASCKAVCTKFFVSFAFESSGTYSKFEKFCGQQYLNTEFTTVKLGGVNCLIQILLQTHNLQRIIFRIFSYQSRKLISNKAKKITKLAWMGSYNYPLIFHRQG